MMDKNFATALLIFDMISASTRDQFTDLPAFVGYLNIYYKRKTDSSINASRLKDMSYIKGVNELLPKPYLPEDKRNHVIVAHSIASRMVPEYMVWLADGKKGSDERYYAMLRYALISLEGDDKEMVINDMISGLALKRKEKNLKKSFTMQAEALDMIEKGRMTAMDLYNDLCELEGA